MASNKRAWAAEGCGRRYDPESGMLITSLTSSGQISSNIYCEQPYTNPEGTRIAIVRSLDPSFGGDRKLLVADLERLRLTMIEPGGVGGITNNAWSGKMIYSCGGKHFRIDLTTCETQPVEGHAQVLDEAGGGSLSPNQVEVAYAKRIPIEGKPDQVGTAIMLANIETGEVRELTRHEDVLGHVMFNPVTGREILFQHNRGSIMDAGHNWVRSCDERGTTHNVYSLDTGEIKPLPAGPPHTGTTTGHSNPVADTGYYAWCSFWNQQTWEHHETTPGGNVCYAKPGDEKPIVFHASEHRCNHINVSRCGKYFVCDSMPESLFKKDGHIRSACIVVGNFETGKYRTLVADTLASGGGGQHTHVHAYFTADNRHVIFQADPYYSPTQVFMVEMTDDFLASLG